jgi:hypothetical protein
MATDLHYNADPRLAGPLSYGAGRGSLLQQRQRELEEIDRFNQQMAQRAAMQEQELQYRAASQAAEMDQRSELAYATFDNQQAMQGQQLQGSFALEELNQQGQMDAEFARGQANVMGAQAQGAAQMARDMNEARLTQAMSEHDAIQKAWTSGEVFTTDEQFQQAQAAWSAKYPDMGGWGLPERIAQQQGDQVEAQQIAQIEAGFVSHFDGKPLTQPGLVQTWMQLGVTPEKIGEWMLKAHTEDRNRQKFEIDKNAGAMKQQEDIANMQRDDQFAAQKQQQAEQAAQQKMEFERLKAEQQLELDRMKAKQQAKIAFQKAKQQHTASKSKTDATTGKAVDAGPEPKWEDYDPGFEDEEEGGQPKLKPGETIIENKLGMRAIKHANGSITVLD